MKTLTARLVATTLVLVTLASVCIGAATTFVMRSYLLERLDRDVVQSLARAARPGLDTIPGVPPGGAPGAPGEGPVFVRGQGVGTLTAILTNNGGTAGFVLTAHGGGTISDAPVRQSALERLAAVEPDGRPHTVSLQRLGDYRVAVVTLPGGRLVSGLPQARVDDAVASLVRWEVVLVLLALGATGTVGVVLVRRQLEPLRDVAATAEEVSLLPLSSGEVDLSARVENADAESEVGRVGVALNTMLAHIEQSLEARHRSEQQVRQFVADASHELRTPLATIRGYSALATAHPEDLDTLRESLAKVSAESDRMSSLVEDLLLLARLDAGRDISRDDVDLARLAVEVVDDARLLAPDHHWVLDVPHKAVELTGDERGLRQVVTNLVSNARLHTPPGTTVRVTVRPRELIVADDGPGFEDAEHALERFHRGDPSRTSSDVSTGLGLAIVDAIVQAHGGTVKINSRPGDNVVSVQF